MLCCNCLLFLKQNLATGRNFAKADFGENVNLITCNPASGSI